ncbi:hypothetical protein [Mycobacterium sp. shizuoka-1]|uniref:hypothetical protein n=1 Tax=Mycobacterium sp. shizuoka-1 TaxID=2039281 RepID=UPI000C0635F5|nr:hypothetical protein [Mycobacterium sp. shizuoka-1]GAY16478.1 hypothetical protein MSZK_32040 [Mycobacterium sp. shizuoka-1]
MDKARLTAPRLAGACVAAIVSLGLVQVPHGAEPASTRTVFASAIELRSSVSELAPAVHSAAVSEQSRRAAVAPRAMAALPDPETVVTSVAIAGAALVLPPLWYIATPVTLPVSFAVAAFAYTAFSMVGYFPIPAPVFILGAGLLGWGVGPLAVATGALLIVAKRLTPAAAAADSTRSAASTFTTRSAGDTHRATRGLASSRRDAITDRKPASHRSAKSTPKPHSDSKKRTGTAGSARGNAKPRT